MTFTPSFGALRARMIKTACVTSFANWASPPWRRAAEYTKLTCRATNLSNAASEPLMANSSNKSLSHASFIYCITDAACRNPTCSPNSTLLIKTDAAAQGPSEWQTAGSQWLGDGSWRFWNAAHRRGDWYRVPASVVPSVGRPNPTREHRWQSASRG